MPKVWPSNHRTNPSFDAFTLGKTMWWMVAGVDVLLLEEAHIDGLPAADVELLCPTRPYIGLFKSLLRKCVVPKESNCLRSASELLSEVDSCLEIIAAHADQVDREAPRRCRVCAVGTYSRVSEGELELPALNVGSPLAAFVCSHCGNFQLFDETKVWSPGKKRDKQRSLRLLFDYPTPSKNVFSQLENFLRSKRGAHDVNWRDLSNGRWELGVEVADPLGPRNRQKLSGEIRAKLGELLR